MRHNLACQSEDSSAERVSRVLLFLPSLLNTKRSGVLVGGRGSGRGHFRGQSKSTSIIETKGQTHGLTSWAGFRTAKADR